MAVLGCDMGQCFYGKGMLGETWVWLAPPVPWGEGVGDGRRTGFHNPISCM